MMKNARLLRNVSVCFLFLALCFVLVGYVESLEELTQPFFKHMERWEGVQVTMERIDPSAESSAPRQHLQLSVFFPGNVRLETLGDDAAAIRTSKGKTNDAFRGLPSHVRTFLDLYPSLTSYDRFARVLKKHGIATTPTRLDRIGKQVCLVAGATADQPGKPQVWLDKWRAAPVRVLAEGNDEKALRLELHNWTSPVTDDRFPQVIDFILDENVVERWETISVKRLDKPGKLFKLEEKK